jgi:hypothetical protein
MAKLAGLLRVTAAAALLVLPMHGAEAKFH